MIYFRRNYMIKFLKFLRFIDKLETESNVILARIKSETQDEKLFKSFD